MSSSELPVPPSTARAPRGAPAHPGHVPAAREAHPRNRPRHEARTPGRLVPGLALSLALAAAGLALGRWPWLPEHGIGPLTLAIVLGMVVGNTAWPRIAAAGAPGVGVAKQTLLRAGIVLYGLRLTFQDVAQVGLAGIAIDACMLLSTFGLACWLGTRVLGLDRRLAMAIGAGSAICGAAAVLAAAPVVRARAAQVTVAVSTVVVFGTLAIAVYPALEAVLHLPPLVYGRYAGSTIHEVAQVVAASHGAGAQAADTAVIAKMVRVMMLAPFLLGLSAWLARRGGVHEDDDAASGARPGRITVPWFALAFVAVAGLHSVVPLPAPVAALALRVDDVLLATAMAALGLTTHASAFREAGPKPLLLAAVLFAWLVVGGLGVNLLLG